LTRHKQKLFNLTSKNIKMKIIKLIFALCFVLSIFSCSKSISDYNKPKYTGEELFRGLFLFQGDIPKSIPTFSKIAEGLNKMDLKRKHEQDMFADEIVVKMNQIAPNYFSELSTAIESKDNYKVDEIMGKGAKLIQVALAQTKEFSQFLNIPENAFKQIDYSKYDLSNQADLNAVLLKITDQLKTYESSIAKDNQALIAIPLVAVAAVVVLAIWDAVAAVNYGAVVNAAALAVVYAAVYAKVVFWPKESVEEVSIQRERIINDIVLNVN
jgi:hypothetical protein